MAAAWSRARSAGLERWQGPVEEIAQVREDLRGRARLVSDVEAGEVVRGATQGFGTAVGDGGDGVAKELPCSISIAGH